MVAIAEQRKESLSEDLRERLEFRVGDMRTIDFHHRYDAVFSLFHVISYMIEDLDLESTFQTARRHLNADGVFIVDFWYGPAVLRHPPQPRKKRIQERERCIQRNSIPGISIGLRSGEYFGG
jgi:spermidine synthase